MSDARADPIPVAKLKAAKTSAEDLARALQPETLHKCSAPQPDLEDGLTQDEKFLAISRLEVSGRTRSSEREQSRALLSPDDVGSAAAEPVIQLRYGWVCQSGFYPEDQNKKNQDNLLVAPDLGAKYPDMSLFGVFDGHGKFGTECSSFAVDRFAKAMLAHRQLRSAPETAFEDALVRVNKDMHRQKRKRGGAGSAGGGALDDTLAGTTCISVLFVGDEVVVANVGDSRAIVATDTTRGAGPLEAQPLSADQTPYRQDERARCRAAGAVVMTMDQLEGYKKYDPEVDDWGDEEDDGGDPPRLWIPGKGCPGVAFTRSLGDEMAESIGCIANPEVVRRRLTAEDKFLVIASDGVFEFLSSQTVVDMVSKFADPFEAARALVAESYKLWLHYEVRTDDITVIVVFTEHRDALPVDGDAYKVGAARGSFSSSREASNARLGQGALQARLEHSTNVPLKGSIRDFEALLKLDQQNRPVRREMSRRKREVIAATTINEDDEDEDEDANGDSGDGGSAQKTAEELEQIQNAISANFLFQHLNPMQLQEVLRAFRRVDVQKGEEVIRQGEVGDQFYVVGDGVYDCFISQEAVVAALDNSADSGEQHQQQQHAPVPKKVHTYEASKGALGNPSFGELALMYRKPRAATVTAATAGHLWALPRRVFRRVLVKRPNRERMAALRAVSVLSSLGKAQLQRLADTVSEVTFDDGELIIRQGDVGDTMYILKEGGARCLIADLASSSLSRKPSLLDQDLRVSSDRSQALADAATSALAKSALGSQPRRGSGSSANGGAQGLGKEVMRLGPGQYFGEKALLNDEPRAASVVAVGPTVCLYVSRKSFEEVLGPLAEIIARHARKRELTSLAGLEMAHNLSRAGLSASLRLADLSVRATVLESGSMRLRIVHPSHQPGRVFTLKSLVRAGVEQENAQDAAMRDRALLPLAAVRELADMSDDDDDEDMNEKASAPIEKSAKRPAAPSGWSGPVFPVLKTFVGEHGLHMALEGVACGPLGDFMGAPLPELTAAFVAADLLLALERLHARGVLCRSVNPQMLLVDDDGRVRLADLHCGKFLEDSAVRTFTMCGLAGYLAPEQAKGSGHGFETDFWALGVLVFEMLTGRLPIAERDFFKAVGGFDAGTLDFSTAEDHGTQEISEAARDFVRQLLQTDPSRRLTSTDVLLRHAFLAQIDEAKLRAGQLRSPLQDAARAALKDMAGAAAGAGPDADVGVGDADEDAVMSDAWFAGF